MDGKKDGKGMYINLDGKQNDGFWKDDVFVGFDYQKLKYVENNEIT